MAKTAQQIAVELEMRAQLLIQIAAILRGGKAIP